MPTWKWSLAVLIARRGADPAPVQCLQTTVRGRNGPPLQPSLRRVERAGLSFDCSPVDALNASDVNATSMHFICKPNERPYLTRVALDPFELGHVLNTDHGHVFRSVSSSGSQVTEPRCTSYE